MGEAQAWERWETWETCATTAIAALLPGQAAAAARPPVVVPEAPAVRPRALPASSSKMRAAAALSLEAARLYHEAADEFEAGAPAAKGGGPAAVWMTIRDYASYRAVSVDTIRRRIGAGMPAEGEGRLTRINKDEADRWWTSNTACFTAKDRRGGSAGSFP